MPRTPEPVDLGVYVEAMLLVGVMLLAIVLSFLG